VVALYKNNVQSHPCISSSLDAMFLRLLYAFLAYCTALPVLSVVRRRNKQAHLRNIPGPPRQSLLLGSHDPLSTLANLTMPRRKLGPDI